MKHSLIPALMLSVVLLHGCAMVPGQRMSESALARGGSPESSHVKLVQITADTLATAQTGAGQPGGRARAARLPDTGVPDRARRFALHHRMGPPRADLARGHAAANRRQRSCGPPRWHGVLPLCRHHQGGRHDDRGTARRDRPEARRLCGETAGRRQRDRLRQPACHLARSVHQDRSADDHRRAADPGPGGRQRRHQYGAGRPVGPRAHPRWP